MRGAMPVETGVPDRLAEKIPVELRERGLQGEPVGIDMTDLVTLEALAPGRHPRRRRLAGDARGAEDQDRRRDRAARPRVRHRRRGLRGDLRDAPPGRLRARGRRARPAAPVRAGLGAGRGDQRRLRRPLQPASARLLRPAAAAGRPGLLRHHPLLHGLPHLLLPHVQRRRRSPSPSSTRTSSAASGWTRRSTSSGPARRPTRSRPSGRPREELGFPTRRLLRPPVRPRRRRRASTSRR